MVEQLAERPEGLLDRARRETLGKLTDPRGDLLRAERRGIAITESRHRVGDALTQSLAS